MPFPGRGFNVHRCQLCPLAVNHLIKAEIVFQWIHSGDVIIFCIFISPNQSAALIDLSGHGLKCHPQIDIQKIRFFGHAQVE